MEMAHPKDNINHYQNKINELKGFHYHAKFHNKILVLVEGDSDVLFFKKLIDNVKLEAIPGGNPKVEKAVEELLPVHRLTIGIRDADFLHLNIEKYQKENIFLTDVHDIEMLSLNNEQIFLNVSTTYQISQSLHELCQELYHLSLIKWFNSIGLDENDNNESHGFNFKGLKINKIQLTDLEDCIVNILAMNPLQVQWNSDIIKSELEQLKARNPDVYQLTNGHDLILHLKNFCSKNISSDELERFVRGVYRAEDFKQTKLWQDVSNWQENIPESQQIKLKFVS